MGQITGWLNKATGLSAEIQGRIFISLLIVFLLWLVRTIIVRLIWRRTDDAQIRYRWQKTSQWP